MLPDSCVAPAVTELPLRVTGAPWVVSHLSVGHWSVNHTVCWSFVICWGGISDGLSFTAQRKGDEEGRSGSAAHCSRCHIRWNRCLERTQAEFNKAVQSSQAELLQHCHKGCQQTCFTGFTLSCALAVQWKNPHLKCEASVAFSLVIRRCSCD